MSAKNYINWLAYVEIISKDKVTLLRQCIYEKFKNLVFTYFLSDVVKLDHFSGVTPGFDGPQKSTQANHRKRLFTSRSKYKLRRCAYDLPTWNIHRSQHREQ